MNRNCLKSIITQFTKHRQLLGDFAAPDPYRGFVPGPASGGILSPDSLYWTPASKTRLRPWFGSCMAYMRNVVMYVCKCSVGGSWSEDLTPYRRHLQALLQRLVSSSSLQCRPSMRNIWISVLVTVLGLWRYSVLSRHLIRTRQHNKTVQ